MVALRTDCRLLTSRTIEDTEGTNAISETKIPKSDNILPDLRSERIVVGGAWEYSHATSTEKAQADHADKDLAGRSLLASLGCSSL